MNILDTPLVPTLSDFRLSTRQEHLVQEIAGRRRNRRRGGLALGGGALVASGVTTALLVLPGPGTANAFAAWTAAPTTPAPDQVSSAEATCETAAATPPRDKTSGLATGATQVWLVDTRGPFTLVLFGANASTTLMCVSGPSINSSTQVNSQMRLIGGGQAVLPEAGQIAVDRLLTESANDGQAYTIAEGSVGSGVTAATLVLSDGSDIVTTTGNGFFLAWWPGSAVVTSATVTTATGTTTQPIRSSTPDTGGSGNTVKRSIDNGQ
jgi:hypothetical protein